MRSSMIALLLGLHCLVNVTEGYTFFPVSPEVQPWPSNPDAKFDASKREWESENPKVKIPYFFSLYHTEEEIQAFKDAAESISQATKNCIKFIQRESLIAPVGERPEVIQVQHRDSQGNFPAVCKTVTGFAMNTGGHGQAMFAAKSANPNLGCLQGSENDRDTVRLLMNTLGIANEFNRADRDQFMNVFPDYKDRIAPELVGAGGSATLFDIKTQLIAHGDLDIESVTMVSPERFAKSKDMPLFRLNRGRIPRKAQLSQGDCRGINRLYACNIDCSTIPSLVTGEESNLWDHLSQPIRKHMNCWEGNDEPIVIPKTLITFAPLNTSAPANLSYSINEDSSQYIQIVSTLPSDKVEFQLIRSINATTRLFVELTGTDPTSGDVIAQGELSIELICLPRLTIDGQRAICDDPSRMNYFGSSNVKCTLFQPRSVQLTTCTDGKVPANFAFRPAETDGQVVLHDAVVRDASNNESRNWIKNPQSGLLINAGDPLDAGRYKFTVTYLDKAENTASILEQTIVFECIPGHIDIGSDAPFPSPRVQLTWT